MSPKGTIVFGKSDEFSEKLRTAFNDDNDDEDDEDDENYEDDECHLPKLSNVELCKGILILW